MRVIVSERVGEREPQELYSAIEKLADELSLSSYVIGRARDALRLLEEAEARVHGGGKSHFHELGSADTLLDIVGAPLLIEELGLSKARIVALPPAVGGGAVRISHGVVSAPAPATLEVLRIKGLPFLGGPVEGELTTPTGAALLCTLATDYSSWIPKLKVERVGYGAGSRGYGVQPLRLMMGFADRVVEVDEVSLIETNVDDVDGESMGYLRERLAMLGALDVYFYPAVAKKGRPGFTIQVIARPEDEAKLALALMEESGTLGVRIDRVMRIKLPRKIEEVEVVVAGFKERVRVKVAWDRRGRVMRLKPEYEDLARIAARRGLPLRVVREAVMMQLRRLELPLEGGGLTTG